MPNIYYRYAKKIRPAWVGFAGWPTNPQSNRKARFITKKIFFLNKFCNLTFSLYMDHSIRFTFKQFFCAPIENVQHVFVNFNMPLKLFE